MANRFGIQEAEPAEQPAEGVVETPAAEPSAVPPPEQPTAEAAPPAEAQPEAPAPTEAQAQPEGQEPAAPEAETRVFAGKYASPEALEAGYTNLQSLFDRQQDEREQMRQALSQLYPIAQAVADGRIKLDAQGQPVVPGAMPTTPSAPATPEPDINENPQAWAAWVRQQATADARAQAETLLTEELSKRESAWQAAQQQGQASQADLIMQTVVAPRTREWAQAKGLPLDGPSPEWGEVQRNIGAFNIPVAQELVQGSVDGLDFALELSRSPQLAEAALQWTRAQGNTGWAQTAEGRAFIRRQAGIVSPPPGAPNGQQPAAASTAANGGTPVKTLPAEAFVETGPGAGPTVGPPGASKPVDNWARTMELADQLRTPRSRLLPSPIDIEPPR